MELEANWPRVARIWWAIAWRMLIVGAIGAATGAALYLSGRWAGGSGNAMLVLGGIFALLVSLGLSVVAVKLSLCAAFDDFRLALLPVNVVLPRSDQGEADTTIRV